MSTFSFSFFWGGGGCRPKNPTPILPSDSVASENEYEEVMFKRHLSTGLGYVNRIMINHKEGLSHSLIEDLLFCNRYNLKTFWWQIILYFFFKSALFAAKRIDPPPLRNLQLTKYICKDANDFKFVSNFNLRWKSFKKKMSNSVTVLHFLSRHVLCNALWRNGHVLPVTNGFVRLKVYVYTVRICVLNCQT